MARILVIGPGALGIVCAVQLSRAGHDVILAARTEAKADRLARNGIAFTTPEGQRREAVVPVVHEPDEVEQPVDLLLHTTKCHNALDVLHHWLPVLADDGWVVPFQNGVLGDRMQKLAGDRYMECSVYFPATLESEGHSVQTATGQIIVGPWPGGACGNGSPAAGLAATLSAINPARPHPDMRAVKWSKLTVNSAMTSLGVITGATMQEMMRHRDTRRLFLGVLREGLAVMEAQGLDYVRVGNAKPDLLQNLPDWVAHVVLRALARKYRDYRSSSAQSLARGEATEVDHLNGTICHHGKKLGVPTPVNDAILEAIHALEAGRGRPGLESAAHVARGATWAELASAL